MSIAIRVEELSKQYRLGEVGTGTLSHDLNRWWARVRGKEDPFARIGELNDRRVKGESDWVWALKDINFDVRQGDVLGIIGRNGAGKSTLLKILSKVTKPSGGRILTKGRIASLLEVGTGFHPEMTGRENIYLNGAIMGMSRLEIRQKFDEIVDFAGVERYIDTPVKRYSSGMYVRLAFAVAAHLESEILIVDEVLAVGDAEFQKKCLGKMGDVSKKDGRTVLFVSHNMGAIENLCNRSVCLSNGALDSAGNTKEVIERYLSSGLNTSAFKNEINSSAGRLGSGILMFSKVHLIDPVSGNDISEIKSGSSVSFRIYFENPGRKLRDVMIGIGVNDQLDSRVSFMSNSVLNQRIDMEAGQDHIDVLVPRFPFTPGIYSLTLYCSVEGEVADWIQNAFHFNVCSGDFYNTGREIPQGQGNFLFNYSFQH